MDVITISQMQMYRFGSLYGELSNCVLLLLHAVATCSEASVNLPLSCIRFLIRSSGWTNSVAAMLEYNETYYGFRHLSGSSFLKVYYFLKLLPRLVAR